MTDRSFTGILTDQIAPGELTGKPDGKIDDADRMVIGNPHPRLQGGMTNVFTWKRFELNCMIHFAYDFDVYYASRAYWWDLSTVYRNLWRHLTRCVICSTAGRNRVMLPMCQKQRFSNPEYSQMSSRFIHDASFVRLKTLMLSYSLPFDQLKKLKIQRLRIFITGQNLFTWTKYPGFDPELSNAGTRQLSTSTWNTILIPWRDRLSWESILICNNPNPKTIMKNILPLLILFLCLFGCDDLLEVTPENQLIHEQVFADKTNAYTALMGMYYSLKPDNYIHFSNLASDDVKNITGNPRGNRD